jgi:hypothetical protein
VEVRVAKSAAGFRARASRWGQWCVAAGLIALAGCAWVEPAYLANGMKVVRIACGMTIDAGSSCYKMAGDICGRRGFALFDWDGKPWQLPYPDPASLENELILGTTSLLVACRS